VITAFCLIFLFGRCNLKKKCNLIKEISEISKITIPNICNIINNIKKTLSFSSSLELKISSQNKLMLELNITRNQSFILLNY
jgi:hypothetical protein